MTAEGLFYIFWDIVLGIALLGVLIAVIYFIVEFARFCIKTHKQMKKLDESPKKIKSFVYHMKEGHCTCCYFHKDTADNGIKCTYSGTCIFDKREE